MPSNTIYLDRNKLALQYLSFFSSSEPSSRQISSIRANFFAKYGDMGFPCIAKIVSLLDWERRKIENTWLAEK
jgi:hypothetical protein